MSTAATEERYKALMLRAVAMRKHVGFNPATWDNLGTKTACMWAETVELEIALVAGDQQEIAAELADIALYTLTSLGDLEEPWCLRSYMYKPGKFKSPGELTAPARFAVRAVFESWRRGQRKDTIISLELLLLRCIDLAATLDIDLEAAISAKIEFNLTRPTRHGGKNPNT